MTASQSSLFVRQDDDDLDGASAAGDTTPRTSKLSRFLVFWSFLASADLV